MSEPGKQQLLETLSEISREYGVDPEFVLAGGGNTSAKLGERIFVKGSGHALATITADGFVEMHRPALEEVLNSDLGSERVSREEKFKRAIMLARVEPEKAQRPSVEVVLHHVMPGTFVVHTHATVVNMFTCAEAGKKLIHDLLGDSVVWLADVDPGHVLAQTLRDALKDFQKRTGQARPRAVIMQNHGLVVSGESAAEIREQTNWLLGILRAALAKTPKENPFGPITRADPAKVRRAVNLIGPALRGLLATDENLKIVTFDDSPAVMELVGGTEGKRSAAAGPMTPDQLVYCRSFPMWLEIGDETAASLIPRLRAEIAKHTARTKFPPLVFLVAGIGMFTAGDDIAGATTVRRVYTDAIKIMAGARRLGGIRYLLADKREFFEQWEVETYRQQIAKGAKKAGRATGKVAFVTGAAQGFGLEIAQDLAREGAHVVLTDMNVAGAASMAEQLAAKHGAGKTIGLGINVTDGASIDEAMHQTVRNFGGFDVLISNAGVLKAGSVKDQAEKDFDLTTSVNYKGYFLCVQKASAVLSVQHAAKPEVWSDIIQINSKSGLQGSNKNFAYAGSKFGGIGLTQSFALELIEDGVKVNSICPGNFFDGPLWSDPNHGLFVQYLRGNKVPGAKTIEDVKRFYEAKVPMGRGCTTADVMKAVYYLIEQKYETGQAVPVTGGQVMLK
jgi:rhamnose utilization protein RhaD (predicted bifunctional aldolase and dehydrogenase)/NAD(P)-dependent dehydrogenase (short-subunit alcohol dehydrogenase family)